jgi:hypothetical protein
MMKKLFVLLMVVGMVSVANAGLVLVAPTPPTQVSIQTDPIDSSADPASVFIAATGTVHLDAGTMLYTGSAAAITPFSDDPDAIAGASALVGVPVTRIDLVELQDLAVPPLQVKGVAVTYNVMSGQGLVYMLDLDLTQSLGSVVIPEPVTITLLGLGGLLLRRRK